MAIRERKGRASPWQCYWNNPLTGKRECANFATRHEAEKHDSLIKHRLKFDRESFQKEEEAEESQETNELTLEQAYLLYLREKQFTKKGLEWQMDSMRYPLQRLGTLPINCISKQHLEDIKKKMLEMPVKPVSVRGRLSVFRTILRWCVAQGLMEPISFPQLPPAQYEKFIPPSPAELEAIMRHAALHIMRVVILGAQCGVRVGPSEMFGLTWDDVDFSRSVLRVHGAKKNPKAPWREVPIRSSLLPIFASWKEADEKEGMIYIIHHNGKPIQKIKRAWENALHRAGINRRIRPYDLRHAFATELIAVGVDIGTVAKLMGHSDASMLLKHYQYVLDTQKRAAVEALPDIPACVQYHVPNKQGACDMLTNA